MTEARLPEHGDMVRNVTAAWHGASAEDLAAGLRWYDEAHATAAALAAGTDGRVSVDCAAAVIAALSPRQHWDRNVRLAALVTDAWTLGLDMPGGAFRRQLDTAVDILEGRRAGPSGPKVAAFHRAIMGDPSAVVIDVWAARAAGIDMPNGTTMSERRYHAVAAAYREAADTLGVAPRDLQAAVWVATRGRAS
jgi:hypothetical protein